MCPSGPIGVAISRGRLPCLPASDKNRYYYSVRHGSLPLQTFLLPLTALNVGCISARRRRRRFHSEAEKELSFFPYFNCVESRLHLNKESNKSRRFLFFLQKTLNSQLSTLNFFCYLCTRKMVGECKISSFTPL